MSKYVEVVAIVEGKTEQIFIEKLLSLELAKNMVGITAIQASKPGQKGGDIHWKRIKRDLEIHLKQRSETFVTTMIDYYGVKQWPGTEQMPQFATPDQISSLLNKAAYNELVALCPDQRADQRFIPYVSIHEFEALLFSDTAILAQALGVKEEKVLAVLEECGTPEAINKNVSTAPSKRLERWARGGNFAKAVNGISIASKIGIPKMRQKCLLFNDWLERLEKLPRK